MVAISIIIPSFGRGVALLDTLADLGRQSLRDWECLVIIQGNPDLALERRILHSVDERVRLIRQVEPNASRARNRGLICARGPVVLFLDDDVRILDPEFLRRHLEPYADPCRSGVFGQVRARDGLVRTNRHPWSKNPQYGWLYFPANFATSTEVRAGSSNNLSVRKDWAIAVGGFDERFEKGAHREETDFCLRLTDRYGPLIFSPDAWLIHLGEPSGGSRSWGMSEGVVPAHHAVGEWYFIMKRAMSSATTAAELIHYTVAALRRQLLNRGIVRRPWLIVPAILRMFAAQARAIRALREGSLELGSCEGPGVRARLRAE